MTGPARAICAAGATAAASPSIVSASAASRNAILFMPVRRRRPSFRMTDSKKKGRSLVGSGPGLLALS